jgi:hypothetical protein
MPLCCIAFPRNFKSSRTNGVSKQAGVYLLRTGSMLYQQVPFDETVITSECLYLVIV